MNPKDRTLQEEVSKLVDEAFQDFLKRSYESVLLEEPFYKTVWDSQCQHEYVNVGFSSIRMVCKKCDVERG